MATNQRTRSVFASTLLLVVIFCVFTAFVYYQLPVEQKWTPDGPFSIGVDWKGRFHPAIQSLIHGQSPYPVLQNPPWVLFLLLPIGLLPEALGAALMFVLSFFGYAFVCYRMGLKIWVTALILILPLVWGNAITGNIDWLVAMGFILPPQIGLFFVLLKPQLGIGVCVFWVYHAWQRGRWGEVAKLLAPVTLAFLLSFALFGFWPVQMFSERMVDPFNASHWPLSASLGGILLFESLRKNNFKLAICASPFLSPYITFHGYTIAFLGLDGLPAVIGVTAFWLAQIYQLLKG